MIELIHKLEERYGSLKNVPESDPILKKIRKKYLNKNRKSKVCIVTDKKTGEKKIFNSLRKAGLYYGFGESWASQKTKSNIQSSKKYIVELVDYEH